MEITKKQEDIRKNIVKSVEIMLEDATKIDNKLQKGLSPDYEAHLTRVVEIAKLLQLEYFNWNK